MFNDSGMSACEEAAKTGSYVGCDYEAVPLANVVWSVFDFAVVVANASTNVADITVTNAGTTVQTTSVAPNAIAKIYLPWIPKLKGADSDMCGTVINPDPASAHVQHGAYHITSTQPVSVYQFNAIEYQGVGGPPGKDWSNCPGFQGCIGTPSCYSYSNDASILFPTTAWTQHVRVAGAASTNAGGTYFAVTAMNDNTHVTVQLSSLGAVLAGDDIVATSPNGMLTFTMNAEDVAEVVGPEGITDFSGSLVSADQPIQVHSGHPCRDVPDASTAACDHLETNNPPAETLGQHYFVEQPTGPYGGLPGAVVRLYGNADGTALTYPQGMPPGAPAAINAGDVVDLGVVNQDFEVQGTHEFAVASLMLGGMAVDPSTGEGDPSISMMVPVEQYLTEYVFLAPDDYDISYADVVQPIGALLTLDGAAVNVTPTPIGSSGYGVARINLPRNGNAGAHFLTATSPVSLQVLGYGEYTSYQYPGGGNLQAIAPTPK
jgi:hypothetical protein